MSSNKKGRGQEGALAKMLERQEGAAGSSICGPRYLEDVTKETAGVCVQQGRHIAQKFESGWEVGVIKAFDKKGPHAGKFSVKSEVDP
jgi:hypothetical protein